MKAWLLLAGAIVFEVGATSALKASDGLTRLWPSLTAFAGYALAFWLLALALRSIPVGVAYAIWAGVGIALITLLAWVLFGQKLDTAAMAGIALIVAGVVVIAGFSRVTLG